MRLTKFFTICLILLSISGICFGQETIEDENWLKGVGGEADYVPYLLYQFRTFTKEDVPKGKQRLKTVRQFAPKNEWEGIYYENTMIGDSKLIWNAEGGFFKFYFYHSLKTFDYGRVNNSQNSVELISEKTLAANSSKSQSAKTKLIRVKVGERRFLVPETHLQDFCDKAAGLIAHFWDFYYYWIKEEDMYKKDFGLPVLPSEYKHLLRYPIEAKIIRVGNRNIVKSKNIPSSDELHYLVTLNAGKNKNIKKEMNFFVEELDEWILVTKVFQKSALGFIRRDFDENKQEECGDSEGGYGVIIPCKKIKIGMKAKTKGSL